MSQMKQMGQRNQHKQLIQMSQFPLLIRPFIPLLIQPTIPLIIQPINRLLSLWLLERVPEPGLLQIRKGRQVNPQLLTQVLMQVAQISQTGNRRYR
jgi:hypothetical protein